MWNLHVYLTKRHLDLIMVEQVLLSIGFGFF